MIISKTRVSMVLVIVIMPIRFEPISSVFSQKSLLIMLDKMYTWRLALNRQVIPTLLY